MSDFGGWRGWDDEQMERDAKALKGDDGILKLQAQEEPYIVRFLPAREDEESAIKVLWQHFFEFPDNGTFSFNCPKMMARQHCDGCALVERLKESGSSSDEKMAKKFMAKVNVVSRLVLRGDEGFGPRIFRFGRMIFDELKLLRKNPRQGGDFTDPTERGYDIEIMVTGEKMERRYKIYPGQRGPLADPEQVREWLNMMPSLDGFAKILPPEAIRTGLRLGQPSLSAPRAAEPPRMSNQAAPRTLESRNMASGARPRNNNDPIF
mgnify:CR=1 FL=1